jgi:Flp pilus assembly pilin Flp
VNKLARALADHSHTRAIDYGLIVDLLVVAIIAAVTSVEANLSGALHSVAGSIN